ncbi:DUF624 domain-containing protein [Gracilibacillus sp. YIM 98692]|uniref:YesL family protein n=1 Tax=Gracilibacillus sp. YIM 98692 TaxID=2663532 RepID=UPI0013D1C418|nr:DUF624 domain-containing protein [Gracilibacillus sp. YIM 98692]
MNGLMSGVYKYSLWISRLAFLNVLWVFFSLIGLIIFGFFPATVAMFSIVRDWVKGKDDQPIISTFIKNYRKELIKGNLLGMIILFIGLILIIDIRFLFHNNSGIWMIVNGVTVMVTVIYLLTVLYVFPVFVQYELKLIDNIKNAFFYMLANPKATFMMVAATITLYLGMVYFPAVAFIFGGSLYAFCLMYYANQSFVHVEQKKTTIENGANH